MATVSGIAETYDLPQFVGELFLTGDEARSTLRLVGITSDRDLQDLEEGEFRNNVRRIQSNQFNLSVDYDLPAASQPSVSEGSDPTFSERDTSAAQNVVQIHQEGFALSYSAQSNQNTLTELGTSGEAVLGQGGKIDPGDPEWQLKRKIEKFARDLNFSFVQGTYAAGSAGAARGTRGISNAVTTNVFDNGGTLRNLTDAIVESALKDMIANGAMNPGSRVVALCDSDQFENLIDLYEPANPENAAPRSVDTIGVMIQTIRTKWGFIDVAYEADMPANEIMIIQPQFMQPVAREMVADGMRKGVLFAEEVAKTGAANKFQLYGQWGFDYGPEWKHGKIADLNA